MVCKEEFLTWFKDLDSFKRIDTLCELINMCIPFELRFLGSYIEEIGKHSYQELRQQALAANDVEKLEKDAGLKNQTLFDETIRHRMLVNVSLLKSRNYNAANWYSKKFLRTNYVEDLIGKEKDETVQNELLLLYTMAARHPAFGFEQKQFFNNVLIQLYELRDHPFKSPYVYRYPPGFEYTAAYKNLKMHENSAFPMGIQVQPPGLPQQMDFMGPARTGWPGIPYGAPSEVSPFPQQPTIHQQQQQQPPQPPTSPLVSSPSQSRSGSPRPVSRPPPFTILTSATPSVAVPTVNPAAPGIPASITTPVAVMTSQMPTMVAIDAMAPPPLGPIAGQTLYGPLKQADTDEDLRVNLKEETSTALPSKPAWVAAGGSGETKQINGMRIPNFPAPPPVSVRTSIADQMQAMQLTDESSHYHSSSSSSPLQTPPDTPSNLAPLTITPTQRSHLDKNRVNGLPSFVPGFGDATSPPPPQPTFTFPYTPVAPPRFYTNSGFRPPVSTVLGQFASNPPYQGGQPAGGAGGETSAPSYHTYTIPYISLMYSNFHPPPPQAAIPPPNPVPARSHPPGCYNCGAATHLGQDCPQHNIDDITQKNTYSIDFSPVNSDNEK